MLDQRLLNRPANSDSFSFLNCSWPTFCGSDNASAWRTDETFWAWCTPAIASSLIEAAVDTTERRLPLLIECFNISSFDLTVLTVEILSLIWAKSGGRTSVSTSSIFSMIASSADDSVGFKGSRNIWSFSRAKLMTVSCQLRTAEVREIMFPMNVATPVKKGMANAGRTTTPCYTLHRQVTESKMQSKWWFWATHQAQPYQKQNNGHDIKN